MFNFLNASNRTLQDQLVLLGTALPILFLFPFSFYRLFTGDYAIAAVDFMISLGLLVIFIQSWRSRKIKYVSAIAIFGFMLGVAWVLHMRGLEMIFWAFPTIGFTYFVLKSGQALLANMAFLVGITTLFSGVLTKNQVLSIYPSLILVGLFGYVFSLCSERQNEMLRKQVSLDPLTKLKNRRSFDEKVNEILVSFKRVPRHVSMLVLDLDFFKKVNDKYGHSTGDEVLKKFANLVRSRIRESDYIYRYGGEEFVVLVKNSGLEDSGDLANSIRKHVEDDKMLSKYNVTVSIGVSQLRATDNADSWFSRADLALYESKTWGRNLVSMADLREDLTVSCTTLDKYRNMEFLSSKTNHNALIKSKQDHESTKDLDVVVPTIKPVHSENIKA